MKPWDREGLKHYKQSLVDHFGETVEDKNANRNADSETQDIGQWKSTRP